MHTKGRTMWEGENLYKQNIFFSKSKTETKKTEIPEFFETVLGNFIKGTL